MSDTEPKFRLPVLVNGQIKISQGWHGPFSHQEAGPGTPDMSHAVDIQVPFGTPVVAARAGRVVAAIDSFTEVYPGRDPKKGLGVRTNHIIVDHRETPKGPRFYTVYSHLAPGSISPRIKNGEVLVKEGDVLATTGPSGWIPTGYEHLHFQTLQPDPEGGRFRSTPFKFENFNGPLEDSQIRGK